MGYIYKSRSFLAKIEHFIPVEAVPADGNLLTAINGQIQLVKPN